MDDSQFWTSAFSNGVLSVGFLYLTYHVPAMYNQWLLFRREEREHVANEREADRSARHKQSSEATVLLAQTWNENQKAIAQIIAAGERREALLMDRLDRVCHYGTRNETQTPKA